MVVALALALLAVTTTNVAAQSPTSLGPTDVVGCGTGFTASSPTITNPSGGAVTYTITSSLINKTGKTEIVLVDTSQFTGTDGAMEWKIGTIDNSSPSRRPKLEVTY